MRSVDYIEVSEARSALFRKMRAYFAGKGYLELDTPCLSDNLIPEPTIYDFETECISEFYGRKKLWLVPSPEVFMKRVIAETGRSVYQFSHCFRNSEQISSTHNPEFTMLEYYTVGADEQDSVSITEELFNVSLPESAPSFLRPPFNRVSMAEMVYRLCSFDLEKAQSLSAIKAECVRLGLTPSEDDTWESAFDRIFLNFVEPNLPQEKPLVLDAYPSQIECLAANDSAKPYKRRWEMYAGGVEVANCYKELTDKARIRKVFEEESAVLRAERSISGMPVPDTDMSFAEMDMPECSGVAMGMDRLLMLSLNKSSLEGVILFPISDMILDKKQR